MEVQLKKTVLHTAITLALGGISLNTQSALTSSTSLEFDAGTPVVTSCTVGNFTGTSCTLGGTPYTAFEITDMGGSYFIWFGSQDPPIPSDKTAMSMFAPIHLGSTQTSSGQHTGTVDGSENPAIDNPWNLLSNTGMHTLNSPITVISDFGSTKTLDFNGWGLNWGESGPGGIFGPTIPLSGTATITCSTATCASGDNYVLDMDVHTPVAFSSVPYTLHMEGRILAPADTDGDGMPDAWEIANGLDPNSAADAVLDGDNDGLNNLGEFSNGADPNNPDSDNDLWTDGVEVNRGSEPDDPGSYPLQTILRFSPGLPQVTGCSAGNFTGTSCTLGGTPYTGLEITDMGGSYFGVDQDGGGISAFEKTGLAPGPDGGVYVGAMQPASGSHSGCPNGTENPGLDASWCNFGNTGMFLTTNPTFVVDPDVNNDGGLTKTLDFSGFAAEWSSLSTNLGGNPSFPADTGLATLTCSQANCPSGSSFTLDYNYHGSENSIFFFSDGVPGTLHLEGQIGIASDGDLNLDGQVNTADVLLATRIVTGALTPTATQLQHGDVAPLSSGIPDPDGGIDTADLFLIMRKANGLISF